MTDTTRQIYVFPSTVTRQDLLQDGSDRRLRRLLYEVTALAERIEVMRSAFSRRLGVSPPQYNILMHIAQNQGEEGLTASDVATALRVTRAHVTKETGALIDSGLLQKAPNPNDGRSILLRITDQGAEAIAALAPVLQRVNDELFGSLTRERFQQMSDAVTSVLKDAEKTVTKLPAHLDD